MVGYRGVFRRKSHVMTAGASDGRSLIVSVPKRCFGSINNYNLVPLGKNRRNDIQHLPASVSRTTINDPSSSLVTFAANVACGAFKKPARRGPVCPQSYCSIYISM